MYLNLGLARRFKPFVFWLIETRVVFELLVIKLAPLFLLWLIETRVVFESVTRGENIDAVVRLIETRVVFEFVIAPFISH